MCHPLSRNRGKLGLVLYPRDSLEERDGIFSCVFFVFFSNNAILLNISLTKLSYDYIKLINTTFSYFNVFIRGIKFSWPVAHENLT